MDIPIHPIVAEIFKKYKEKTGSYIPVSISNQKMNDYLKEIGELVEFTEEVSQVKKMGNKRIQSKAKKFELITCHTARRSFATNQYLDGVPAYEIMAITGHRTENRTADAGISFIYQGNSETVCQEIGGKMEK